LLLRRLILAASIGAVYAILVGLLPATSVPVVQVRVADVLMPLSIVFGWPAVLGVTIGAGIGNLAADSIFGLSGASIGVDVIGGSLANLVAATLAWKIGSRNWTFKGRRISWLLATNTETIVIAFTVGTYLGWLFAIPYWLSIIGILAGSIVAISIGGYLVLMALTRPKTLQALESTGLLQSARRE
jgi:uncharacterized membrane protein